ncbi:MAG TPA: serine/threonine-protein kinase, partial [Labilithrix sp.]|nr:serine/threonine-protein kinase [Labilithrix sp.]
MEAVVDLAVGSIFAGRYQIARRIAAVGMGAVFEVIHLETERRRALKVMHAHLFQSEELRERFKREAKVAAHVDSEFIVDVFDAGVDEATGMPFLVMELLRGEELGERLKRVGRLPTDEALHYLHQTARALDKTHRASIVHRDLKPANVFLCERDEDKPRVKILDFGIAKVVAEGATTGAATQSLGTPLYMAPEQFNPNARLTGAADIYALGMMAYTLLVGAAYWSEEARGGNVYGLIAVAIGGPTEPASMRAARRSVALPPAFDVWFAKVTASEPAQRFPTATAAVLALAEALGVAPPARGQVLSMSGTFEA